MTAPTPFDADVLPVDDADELAGVVDLFGALSSEEIAAALVELAYRQRGDVRADRVEEATDRAVAWAVERYYLVEYTPTDLVGAEDADGDAEDADGDAEDADGDAEDADGDAEDADGDAEDADRGDTENVDGDAAYDPLLTVGPVAFPSLPEEAEDLPHILDFETRTVVRESLARAVETRLRGDAARAVVAEDEARIQHLFDVTYDLEAWAPVDVGEVRERLEDALAASDEDDDGDEGPNA
ncbi:hypothetical protein C2R22_04600 [Salinigranum rubrum]|uniref:Uncharacterized protein n=1 Tax=Salinigranum rubrum TaxID=755307 RepID=A0A2I8VGJ1_9EURY|nr:hypothetical protein [Salinigranum rubrum]AUV81030.1 hypothetical protein C2R22_04600 [Salinigranum rubrum]